MWPRLRRARFPARNIASDSSSVRPEPVEGSSRSGGGYNTPSPLAGEGWGEGVAVNGSDDLFFKKRSHDVAGKSGWIVKCDFLGIV